MTTVKQAKEITIYVIDNETSMVSATALYNHVMLFEDENKQSTRFDDEEGVWYIDNHRVNRSTTRGNIPFDTEEEAEDDIFDNIYNYDFEKSTGTEYFSSEKEAEDVIIERMMQWHDISKKVAVHIYRKMKIVFIARQIKNAIHRAQITKEYNERKAWLAIEVPKEADSIVIDDEFKTAIKWAEETKGKEKSDRMASAMKGLLSRNGKEKIETDFWQVIRILKAKAGL